MTTGFDPEIMAVSVTVNGRQYVREIEPRMLLVDFLRNELRLTGTHIGCDTTNCGACTVHVDGRSVKSCTMFAVQVDGAHVETVEGLAGQSGQAQTAAQEAALHVLQQAFHECHALQCGYCTPGMLMSGLYLLQQTTTPTREDIKRAIAGNLCRCTGYAPIVAAIELAAKRLNEEYSVPAPVTAATEQV